MIPRPWRWTPLTFLAPRRYLDPEAAGTLDIERWSDSYEWRQDGWNGYADVAKPVARTIDDGTGDCEDYALVVVSWAAATGRDVWLGACFDGWVPRHVIAVTRDHVYSSGRVLPWDVVEYNMQTRYDSLALRPV